MSETPPIFVLEGVHLQVGRHGVLRKIDLTIRAGEQVALVGPSGAGKSSLLSLLNGSQRPTQGRVRLLGRELAALRSRQRRQLQRQVGTVYQQFQLVEALSVVHNVNAGHLGRWSLAKALLSLVYPQAVPVAREALERVGLADKLYERADRLSGGEQQRVAIARVLVQDPVAILADEPIASLDPERARAIIELLLQLSRERGKTLVTSLHAIDLARGYFPRLIGLRQGAIVFDAPAADVGDEAIAQLYGSDSLHN